MKKVYICSPCRGDYENNIQRAKEFSRAAVERGCIPITPHIYLTQFMDDTVPAERELGLSIGRELVLMCDELWAFRAMARCNEHLNHGPISIEVDGRVIIDLAKRLKENQGSRLEIGG